jgi:hypothetical protein
VLAHSGATSSPSAGPAEEGRRDTAGSTLFRHWPAKSGIVTPDIAAEALD